jgi:signal peptidase I
MYRRGNATVLFILAGVTVMLAARTLYRVQTYVIPSSRMAPTLFAGDRVAVDQKPSGYKVNDRVAVHMNEERVTVIRRISSLDSGTVTLVLDKDRDRPVALSSREDLRGRVIYLVYSIDPASWLPRWSRWMIKMI